MTDTALATRLSILYAAVFLSFGIYTPLFPVWLDARGFSASEIGVLMAIPMLLRILALTPVTHAADRSGRGLALLALCWAVSAVLTIALTGFHGFAWMLLGMAVWCILWNPIVPLADAYVLNMVRARPGLDFGRIRTWGSISFIIISLIGGQLLGIWGAGAIIWMIAALLAVPLLLMPILPRPDQVHHAPRAQKGQWRSLVRDRALMLTLTGAALIQSSHAVLYTFGSTHWAQQGIAGFHIGLLWSLGVVAEIILFWLAKPWLARWGAQPFLLIAGVGALVRWLLMAADQSFAALLPLQILHGLTFGAAYLGLASYVTQRVPSELAASVQGVSAMIAAAAMALATLAGGLLWDAVSVGAYAAMAGLGVIGTGLIWFAKTKFRTGLK
jgi:MFS transporter, PPP family, 3-phenylpropionic acid transporter